MVGDIGGQGVTGDSRPSLQVLPDGRLAGNGACNRILGGDDDTDYG